MKSLKTKYTKILVLINIIFSTLLVLMPLALAGLVDEADKIRGGISVFFELDSKLFLYACLFTVSIILMILIRFLENFLHFKWSLNIETSMKREIYSNLLKKKTSKINEFQMGQIQQIFTSDVDLVIKSRLDYIPQIFRQTTRIVLAIIVLVLIDLGFLIFIVFCGLLGYAGLKAYNKLLRPRHKRVIQQEAITSGFVTETYENIKLLKAYDAYKESNEMFSYYIKNQTNAKKSRNKVLFYANSLLFSFSNFSFFIAIMYGSYLIVSGAITVGLLIALLQLLNSIQSPFLSLSSIISSINLGKVSLERINSLILLEEDNIENKIFDFDEIVFDNVCFSYDKIVHSNLSFSIKKNEKILLYGKSGIGKTTIFMLLLGFITPSSGSIKVIKDNKEITLDERCRTLFSYVPQENILFSDTILNNIVLLSKNKKLSDIEEALKLCNVYDDIMQLPNKLNTKLSTRGSGLSVGQIQRILISISLLANKEVLLLDEFSSALDSNNEQFIINTLDNINKTIIYISHKPERINVNKVINLD